MLLRALIAAVVCLVIAPSAFAADRQDEQWGLEMVKAPAAWSTSTGVGAVVAVIDTGVQADHPDLGGRLISGFDFVGNDGNPSDGDGHGTHVTGIVAANRGNNIGISGIAPGAQVMPIRVLDDNGEGFADDVIEGIDYATSHGAHVINLSLGDFLPLQSVLFDDPAYSAALQRAIDKGIVVVIAAGNNSQPRCENPPVDAILCVGAVDSTGNRSLFSSFGDGVDLMAPGGDALGGSEHDVLSTYKNSGYASVAGTSQAAPHVAGVAALLVSLGVTGTSATDRLVNTASPVASLPVVNAEAAVAGLATPPPPDPNDPNPPPTATGSFSTAGTVRARTVRRRGFRVACKAVRPGRCSVVAVYRQKRIARGAADVPASIAKTVTARLNARGKKRLSGLRRKIRVKLTVTLPGEAPRSRRVTVRP